MIYYILPAYNEELNIITLLDKFNSYFGNENDDYKPQVIVVDDGSNDETKKILNKLSEEKQIFNKKLKFELVTIFHERNMGLGEAIKSGMMYCFENGSTEDIIITMDCDNSHTVEQSKNMIEVIKSGKDVVIASRYRKDSETYGVPNLRILLSYFGCIIFKIAFPIKHVKDYTCGFRAFKLEKIKEAFDLNKNFFSEKGFTASVDIILKLNKFNKSLLFEEIPMILRYDLKQGKSKIKIVKTIFMTLFLLFRRRFF
jgi:dolichol-phosphate mannosyltransferase|tara:strand:+ start:338 stop:1105 length:768 start_codon:yes stop_codon:yes gene_type:complete